MHEKGRGDLHGNHPGPSSSLNRSNQGAYPVYSQRITVKIGAKPVLKSKWAWLGIKTHAKHGVDDSVKMFPNLSTKFWMSNESLNIGFRSIPRGKTGLLIKSTN